MELDLSIKKICTECEEEKPLSEFHIDTMGKYGRYSKCKPCKNSYRSDHRNTSNGFFQKLLDSAKCHSKVRKGEASICNIIKEDIIDLWNDQNGKCYYSNIQMNLICNS